MADSTFLPPLPTLKYYVPFAYGKYSCFPKIHQRLHLSANGALYVELLFCICLSHLPDPANLNHHINAAFLPAEEGVQIMPNSAFGYATPQGHQSNTRDIYIQTG